ncbi:DUF2321 domain-containing protein [Lactobacillus sp. PFC-70]|uniref:DUF2321 domain-containing protein n=1 Tax=Levilactobacillus namurensis TaxID=380393 RepID=UPI000D30326A|nr:DUF2321 domain-containing protein [Levilactobacillus namurensis]PTM24132.1 DUF2321 domain-containing protein [Lactobacillus sp. PFC-70]HJE44451.1 DUF2321 domain-containing protein [Levilactobacillus namurensis]
MSTQYAQSVCLNGHQKSKKVRWGLNVTGYCEKCGAELISTCPKCGDPIPGDYDPSGNGVLVLSPGSKIPVPRYCHHCGKPYPWTKSAIDSAQELIDLSDTLSNEEKESFKKSIPDILVDTPKTKLASTKFKIYAVKAGTSIASGLKDILVDIAAETAKRSIWGA